VTDFLFSLSPPNNHVMARNHLHVFFPGWLRRGPGPFALCYSAVGHDMEDRPPLFPLPFFFGARAPNSNPNNCRALEEETPWPPPSSSFSFLLPLPWIGRHRRLLRRGVEHPVLFLPTTSAVQIDEGLYSAPLLPFSPRPRARPPFFSAWEKTFTLYLFTSPLPACFKSLERYTAPDLFPQIAEAVRKQEMGRPPSFSFSSPFPSRPVTLRGTDGLADSSPLCCTT